jgi:hypothetical protein
VNSRFRPIVMIAALVSLSAAGFINNAEACSQCMCGTPFPAGVLGGVAPVQLAYGIEERYLSKTSALDDGPGVEQELEHRIAGFAMWRPWRTVALLGRLPFNMKQVTELSGPQGPGTLTSSGLGDAELTGLFEIGGAASRAMTLGVVLGATAPTGSNDVRGVDGQRLDIHLQPGIGAWSGTAGFNAAMNGAGGTWDASLLDRVSGISAHGYRYGEAVLYNLGITSRTWRSLQLLAQINGRSAARDRLEDGTIGENTGGMVTYATPGLRWRFASGLAIEGALQLPVIQRLYGYQRENTTGRVSLSMNN